MKNRIKIFLKRSPKFFSRDCKLNETKVAEEYCWVIAGGGVGILRPIR